MWVLGSKAFVIWQQEVCDHSKLLQVCHKWTGQISRGHTKQIGLPFWSAPSFSLMVSVLAMRTRRDNLLEAEQHQSHVCYCPLESQLFLKHQSRPGMVILKDFSLACQKHSHILWTTQMECPSVLEHRLVQVSWQGQAEPWHVLYHATKTFHIHYIGRCRHVSDSLYFGFINFTPSFVILWPWKVISFKPVCCLPSFRTMFLSAHLFKVFVSFRWLSIQASSIV